MSDSQWGKYDRVTGEKHLLEHHLADVGAVMERLLAIPAHRQAFAKAGGLIEIDEVTVARLCVFAALHDMGKVNLGFQSKSETRSSASHTKDMMPLLNGKDEKNGMLFRRAIPWLNEALEGWDGRGGTIFLGLMIAMLSHHGKPEPFEGGTLEPEYWHDSHSHFSQQPFEKIEEIARMVKEWFPAAFGQGSVLPSAPEFQHTFLGVLQLADWIGSDTRWFPFESRPDRNYIQQARKKAEKAITAIGLDLSNARFTAEPATLRAIISRNRGRPDVRPSPMQQAIAEIGLDSQVVVLEAETGSGKTESALLYFQRLMREGRVDGLYFALPTRSAAKQIHDRVCRAIEVILPGIGIKPVLAVPGYIKAGEHRGTTLGRYYVHWEDGADEGSRWSAESPKRFLTSRVAVGTVDQAMLSVLQTKHSHLRSAGLTGKLLVVDEVHASDIYMGRILQALVRNHVLKGGHVLMMSATLGAVARANYLSQQAPALSSAKNVEYPCISTEGDFLPVSCGEYQKVVHLRPHPLGDTPESVARLALDAQQSGAKVLVIRNTVAQAVNTYEALTSLSDDPSEIVLHHSRYAAEDREKLDKKVEEVLRAYNSGLGRVVVGTQTLEQSLDIDADYLITDLCPMDVLLQRIGRLHRSPKASRPDKYQDAMCTVLMPEEDISDLIRGGSSTGLGRVYKDLRVIEATKRLILSRNVWEIPKMNRMLVEEATHPEQLEKIVAEDRVSWGDHNSDMLGEHIANGLVAKNGLVDWTAPFYDDAESGNSRVVFQKSNVLTRLGDMGIDIDFPAVTVGPFGIKISKISIPYWMIDHKERVSSLKEGDAIAEVLENRLRGILFRLSTGQEFWYSETGLSKA